MLFPIDTLLLTAECLIQAISSNQMITKPTIKMKELFWEVSEPHLCLIRVRMCFQGNAKFKPHYFDIEYLKNYLEYNNTFILSKRLQS